MSDSNRIFPDISEMDRAMERLSLREAAVAASTANVTGPRPWDVATVAPLPAPDSLSPRRVRRARPAPFSRSKRLRDDRSQRHLDREFWIKRVARERADAELFATDFEQLSLIAGRRNERGAVLSASSDPERVHPDLPERPPGTHLQQLLRDLAKGIVRCAPLRALMRRLGLASPTATIATQPSGPKHGRRRG